MFLKSTSPREAFTTTTIYFVFHISQSIEQLIDKRRIMASSASPSHPPEWDLLLSAAQKNLPEKIRTMIVNDGVPPSHGNVVGQTALHIAALWGNVESVRLLIELGANVNAQNSMTGASPLHMITQSQKVSMDVRLQVIELLIDGGADPALADKYGGLPVTYIEKSFKGKTEPLDAATKSCIAKLRPQDPPIFKAIQERDLSAVQALLVDDLFIGNINVPFRNQTPLSYGISNFLKEIIKIQAPDTDMVDATTSSSNIEKLLCILRALVENGADPNCDVIENLIDDENNTELGDDVKKPAIHELVCVIRECYKMLVSPKANCDQDNSRQQKSFVQWKINHIDTAVQLLLNTTGWTMPSDTTSILHQASRYNECEFAVYLLEQLKLDVNSKGRQNMTPLHLAARSGKIEVLQLLLNQPNIDVNATDDQGKTALDYAKINGKEEIVQLIENFRKK